MLNFHSWNILRIREIMNFSNFTLKRYLAEIPFECLDSDQSPHFLGPDSSPNCLQRLSADSRQRVKD